jgi:hypothetical protein
VIRNGCRICESIPIADLTELDLLMGDASRWPSTIWGVFDPPKGPMNALRQRFGAVRMAQGWLVAHGHAGEFSEAQIRQHYRYDVTVIASDPIELLNKGIIEASPGRSDRPSLPDGEKLDPAAFLTYFDRGIKLGNRGLALLEARIDKMIADGVEIPFPILKQLIDAGGKLAMTQAQLKARGLQLGDAADEDEGFRAGSMPLPSQRVGHNRVRVIEGEARPIRDEGPADREHFDERNRAEGGPGLPH